MHMLSLSRYLGFTLFISFLATGGLLTQEPSSAPPAKVESLLIGTEAQENGPHPTANGTQTNPLAIPAAKAEPVIVPLGTRLPLLLRNGINTRTAKAGDSVYFETAYPIAVNNRMAIPMGSFVRGQILEVKRPGRIRGRGEFRIALEQMTFPNGYTIEWKATPSSVDRNGQEGVDSEGKIKGPSSAGRDTATVLGATGGGAYIGSFAGAVVNGAAGRGALIGSGAAGLGALIAVLATRGPEAELPRGTTMDVVFDRPLILDTAYLPSNMGAGWDPLQRLPPVNVDARQNQRELQKRRMEQSVLRSLLLPHIW